MLMQHFFRHAYHLCEMCSQLSRRIEVSIEDWKRETFSIALSIGNNIHLREPLMLINFPLDKLSSVSS